MVAARRPDAPPRSDVTPADVGQILAALEAVLGSQRRMESELSLLAAEQRSIATSVGALAQDTAQQVVSWKPSASSSGGAQDSLQTSSSCRSTCRRISLATPQVPLQRTSARWLTVTSSFANRPTDASPVAASVVEEAAADDQGYDPAEVVDLDEAADAAAMPAQWPSSESLAASGEVASAYPSGFLGKLAEAEDIIGRDNILKPSEAKSWLDSHPNTLFLDVQDNESPSVPGTYRASLGQLYFKASVDLPDFRDPMIADRDKDSPILVTCGLGGQAKLGAKVLVEYGFNNVKVVDGGCMAWKSHFSHHPSVLPLNWPLSVQRRMCFGDETEVLELSGQVRPRTHRSRSTTQMLEEPPIIARSLSAKTNSITTSMNTLTSLGSGSAASGEGRRPFILAPCSSTRIALDLLSVCLLVFDLITVPWLLAWDIKLEGWLFVTSVITVCFWTVDIFVNFRTGFFFHGEAKMSPALIARRYLKTWFIPDLLMVTLDWASVMLLIIDRHADLEQQNSSSVQVRVIGIIRFTKWSRVLRLVSMARFVRFSDVFERILDRSYYSPTFLVVLQVLRLLFFIVYVNHFGACLWWGIGNISDSSTRSRWVDLEVDDMGYTYSQADAPFQYVVCLHWAMTQILAGSMQVFATNSAEHLFTVTCLIFGVLFLSSLVSTLAAKMTQLRMIHQDKNKKLAQLREFLRRKAIGPELAVNIIKQVEDSIKDKKPDTLKELEVWSAVSQRHRRQLHQEICRPPLLKHPFFVLAGQIEPRSIRRLCEQAIEVSVHCQHDTVFSAAKPALQIYSVMSGSLKYLQEPETSMVQCEVEHPVLKGAWVSEAALWTQWTHVGMLEAVTVCELLVLNAQQVAEAFSHSNHTRQVASEYGRAFHARLQTSKPPYADWPNDVLVPYASFEEVMATLSEQVRSYVGMLTLQYVTANYSWSPWNQRLREDVREGRCTVVTAATGDVEIIASSVALQLERADGRVLVQLGTWDGRAAISGCRLPGTRQRSGELPRNAFQRLLQTQLQPVAEAIRLRRCVSEVESKVDSHIFVSRTTTIKHIALVDLLRFPSLPTAAMDSELQAAQSMSVMKSSSFRPVSSHSSTLSNFDEVFLVAGESESTSDFDQDGQPVALRLLTWMSPSLFERLSSSGGQSELRRVLASLFVSQEASQRAHEVWYDRPLGEHRDSVTSLSNNKPREASIPSMEVDQIVDI